MLDNPQHPQPTNTLSQANRSEPAVAIKSTPNQLNPHSILRPLSLESTLENNSMSIIDDTAVYETVNVRVSDDVDAESADNATELELVVESVDPCNELKDFFV